MKKQHSALGTILALCAVLVATAFAAERLDYIDLLDLALNWQKDYTGSSDFNNDNHVDALDVLLLTQEWHMSVPTPTPTPTPTFVAEELPIPLPNFPVGAKPLVVVKINSGSFMMGRNPGEKDSDESEDPQHQVDIGYQFYMGKYEITKAQWEAVVGTTPWTGQENVLNDGDSPAIYVSWDDCQFFISEINKLGQGEFRLPSEAEWEYCCRAKTTTRFYWGNDPSYTQTGNYAWNMENTWNVNEKYAHVVGLKLPNAWNLFDMSGNVIEWCEDDGHSDYSGSGRPDNGSAWIESPRNSSRMLHGGVWVAPGLCCRSAYRGEINLNAVGYEIGFRIVRDAT
jgi:formylglycine-generating enzyme required for sulfatase activity